MKTLTLIALSLATAFGSVPPAQAFPTAPKIVSQATDAQQVQFPSERGEARKSGRCNWPNCVRGSRYDRRGYYDGRRGYYDDRRGYRHDRYRRYYRDDDDDIGSFFGGLATGAIIGGLLSQPRYYNGPRVAGGSPHTRWCYARYRSYRAWDNTYQPYNGPRRTCYSP